MSFARPPGMSDELWKECVTYGPVIPKALELIQEPHCKIGEAADKALVELKLPQPREHIYNVLVVVLGSAMLSNKLFQGAPDA